MPKVSILMNCYNGEEYLVEAIDSVFKQTFKDWEVIFIDNCSIDNSANIAKSYGEKIKYYKTDKNIPLGAARNFGLKNCMGEYISFLDTDDIWFDNTLEKQLLNIESGDYSLVYASQLNIDKDGSTLSTDVIKYKEGNIFPNLLNQFDIPIVTTMLRKKDLSERNLNFDVNIYGSEEYCLFMQLAVDTKFKVIPDILVKYRILNNSLTTKTISNRADDRLYTLDKIISDNKDIEKKYECEFKEAFARADYYKVQYLVSENKKQEARKLLKKYFFNDKRYFFLNVLLYLPTSFWNYIQNKKYSRK